MTAPNHAPANAALLWLLRLPIHLYRWVVSPLLGPRCRFQPSCSEYALDALSMHGAARGSWLTLRRLARCHPWGGEGWDPVPPPAHPGGCAHGHRHDGHPHNHAGCRSS